MKYIRFSIICLIALNIILIQAFVYAEKKPEWINNPALSYPEEKYLTGVGEGDTQKSAEERAYAAIARIFRVEVSSRSVELEKYLQVESKGKTEAQRQVAIEEMTKVTSEKILEDVKIVQTWQDKTTARYYALAVINRSHAAAALKERINILDAEAKDFFRKANEASDKFEKIRNLRRIIRALVLREAYNADFRIVNSAGTGLESPINPGNITQELEEFLSKEFNVYVTVAGDNSRTIRKAVIEGLNRDGFSVLKENGQANTADLLIIGEAAIWKADIPDPKWKYVRWCADFQLIDAKSGKTFGNISRTGREGHLTLSEAENKAVMAMQKEIVSVIIGQAANFVYGEAKPLEDAGAGCGRERAAVSEEKKVKNKKETDSIPITLITQAEALLPNMSDVQYENIARDIESKSDSTGPIIKVVTPEEGKVYAPPVNIELNFITKGLAEIDLSTLKVEYLKLFSIDITQRVLPYVSKQGIKISNAQFPSGTHNLKITIGDKKGAVTIQKFTAVIK
ncbi:MAG: LPP20 family lipoprotein [Nitrospirae bacterium]|nr:LPP20 family lipoprotein [Nitrospirota bacterium]